MNLRRKDSTKESMIFVLVSLLLVSAALFSFSSKIPGIILAGIIIAYLEYSRAKSNQSLYKMVFVDEITGLPNQEQMRQVLENRIKANEAFFLCIFDIKSFKIINELWGFEKGDDYLKYVGTKIMEFSDIFDFACRLENDNFAVMFKNSSSAVAMDVMDTLFNEIDQLPWDENYHVLFSAGIVQQDGNYEDPNAMFDCAKIAKSIAKKNVKTQIVVYDEETKEEMIRQQKLKDNLHEGLKNDEFVVYLQPKYNVADDTLAGAEALIRWNFKHESFMPPGLFVPVFEEDGSIGLLDHFVLLKVADKFKEWMEQGYEMLPISVNVSRVQLANQNLVKEIAAAVAEREIPFKYIDLELTESAAFDNMDRLLSIMEDIKKNGFKLSMDDFGTGFSSLGLLRKMPLDILKLDKSFVDAYVDETCVKEKYMICDIINMAHHLGITVLAEGVENSMQRDLLKEAGCEIIQGYYYSKPLPIDEYEKLLKKTEVSSDSEEETEEKVEDKAEELDVKVEGQLKELDNQAETEAEEKTEELDVQVENQEEKSEDSNVEQKQEETEVENQSEQKSELLEPEQESEIKMVAQASDVTTHSKKTGKKKPSRKAKKKAAKQVAVTREI